MTEYKENVWYGWNGGECPVHPKSKVEAVTDAGVQDGRPADDWDWGCRFSPIRAFRVVKPYREPLEAWAAIYGIGNHMGLFATRDEARLACPSAIDFKLFREVTEGQK